MEKTLNTRDTRAFFAPVTHDSVPKGAKWDYHAHARLAYGLIQNEDDLFPSFGERDIEKTVFAECIRQSTLLALRRNPELNLGSEDADTIRSLMQDQQGIVPTDTENDVRAALDRADDIVTRYFDDEKTVSLAEGEKLVDEIIESDRRRMVKRVEDSVRVN